MQNTIKNIMTCYDSKNKFYEFNLPKKILKLENQIDYYNRKLSRKKYKSNRYNLLRLKINKLYEKVYNIKKDFIFKISNYLSKTYNIINFESFNFKLANNLKRSRRKLYRIAIYTLLEVLKYKTKEYNTKLNLEKKILTLLHYMKKFLIMEMMVLKNRWNMNIIQYLMEILILEDIKKKTKMVIK